MSSIPAPALTPQASQRLGVILFLCGLVTFSIFDASSKYLLETYPAPFLNIMRYATVAFIAVAMLIRHAGPGLGEASHKGMLIARGVALGTVGTCFMTALTWMPLAEATAIYFTSPLIVVALSPWFLQEKVGYAKWIAVMAGFAGMLLVVRPGNDLPLIGTVLMIASAVSFAIFQLLTRKLAGKVAGSVQYAYTAFVCVIITGLPAPFFLPDPWPSLPDFLFILSLGICNGAGQLLLLAAFQRVAASTLAPLNYCQLLMAVAFSAYLFNQPPDTLAMMGIALITVAGVFLALPRVNRPTP
jgi:drug/metabolite transporter (DMT)-like permease